MENAFDKLTKEELSQLRLKIVPHINRPDSYYQTALLSRGVDIDSLTHAEISAWTSAMKVVETDILINTCMNAPAFSDKELNNVIDSFEIKFKADNNG